MQNNYLEARRISSLNSANIKSLKNPTVNKFEENEETFK
jgi:hypothetical protein